MLLIIHKIWLKLQFHQKKIPGQTEGNFHVIIPNEDVEQAYKDLRHFIVTELEKQQAEGVFVSLKPASSTNWTFCPYGRHHSLLKHIIFNNQHNILPSIHLSIVDPSDYLI